MSQDAVFDTVHPAEPAGDGQLGVCRSNARDERHHVSGAEAESEGEVHSELPEGADGAESGYDWSYTLWYSSPDSLSLRVRTADGEQYCTRSSVSGSGNYRVVVAPSFSHGCKVPTIFLHRESPDVSDRHEWKFTADQEGDQSLQQDYVTPANRLYQYLQYYRGLCESIRDEFPGLEGNVEPMRKIMERWEWTMEHLIEQQLEEIEE